MTEIDWTQNCLTKGIHNGREGSIWNIPLNYAVIIFRRTYLRDLVIERIYSDAMQYVEHALATQKETGAEVYPFNKEWAQKVRERAEELYDNQLQVKVGEISNYYKTPGWELEQQEAVRRVKEGTLNTHYKPLHDHDTINLLCRIIGVSSSIHASQ